MLPRGSALRRSPLGLLTSIIVVLIALAMLPPLYALRALGEAAAHRAASAAARHPAPPLAAARDAAGNTRRQYFATQQFKGNAEERARAWITATGAAPDKATTAATTAATAAAPASLALTAVRRSPSGEHVRLQQICAGFPVWGAEAVASFDSRGRPLVLASDLAAPPGAATALAAAAAMIPATDAIARALAAAGVEGELHAPPQAALWWRQFDGAWRLCQRVECPAGAPAGDWEVWLDAHDGRVLGIHDRTVWERVPRAAAAAGRARIFNPDPCLATGDPGLTDHDNAATAVPAAAYTDVVLRDLAPPVRGQYRLAGPWVTIEDWEAPAIAPDSSATGDFSCTRAAPAFEAAMVYYHLDAIQRWYQFLGFTDANHRTQVADAHGVHGLDNSKFLPSVHKIAYGDGGVDDGEDAEVIVHEYGHATQFDIVPTWGTGGHTAAMGEGFGDYLAHSYAWSGAPGRVREWNGLFQWDGHNEFWPGRRAVDNTLHYPEDAGGEPHRAGTLWCSALVEALYAIGDRAVMDRLVIDHHYALTGSATMEDAANAILASDIALYGAAHVAALVEVFARWGLVDAAGWQAIVIEPVPVDVSAANDGPPWVEARVASTVGMAAGLRVRARVRVVGGPELEVPLAPLGAGRFGAQLPHIGGTQTTFEYTLEAQDEAGHTTGAPAAGFDAPLRAERGVYADRCESDTGWQAGAAGDDAFTGRWVRGVPVGTAAQPALDHTSNGSACFVTGNGVPGAPASDSDVDGGATTLLSPVYDLHGASSAAVSYWRWYSNDTGMLPADDEWRVDLSNDGGATWTAVERLRTPDANWRRIEVDVGARMGAPRLLRLRFVAADRGTGSIVEAAVDDILVQARFPSAAPEPAAAPRACFITPGSNPWRPGSAIRFGLAAPGAVRVTLYDTRGRVVRTLLAAGLPAGERQVSWDGRDDGGRAVPPGVYLVQLATPTGNSTHKLTVLRHRD